VKLPRDVSGDDLARCLIKLGYTPTRQTGSHIRFTRTISGEHSITIPRHANLKIGTLNNILNDVAEHLNISKQELRHRLWDS
jgi:predicted RNA binding protein YcfA (HicA-like mRNA interferase family)